MLTHSFRTPSYTVFPFSDWSSRVPPLCSMLFRRFEFSDSLFTPLRPYFSSLSRGRPTFVLSPSAGSHHNPLLDVLTVQVEDTRSLGTSVPLLCPAPSVGRRSSYSRLCTLPSSGQCPSTVHSVPVLRRNPFPVRVLEPPGLDPVEIEFSKIHHRIFTRVSFFSPLKPWFV